MISEADEDFWRLYASLPKDIQKAAKKAFRLFQQNPDHPSLLFKPLQGDSDFYSARINAKYRAVGQRDGAVIVWFWIGSHADFDKEFS